MDYRCPQCYKNLLFRPLPQGDYSYGMSAASLLCPYCRCTFLKAEYSIDKLAVLRARIYRIMVAAGSLIGLIRAPQSAEWLKYALTGMGCAVIFALLIEASIFFLTLHWPRYVLAEPKFISEASPITTPSFVGELSPGDRFTVLQNFDDGQGGYLAKDEHLVLRASMTNSSGGHTLIFDDKRICLREDRHETAIYNIDHYIRLISVEAQALPPITSIDTPTRKNSIFLLVLGLLMFAASIQPFYHGRTTLAWPVTNGMIAAVDSGGSLTCTRSSVRSVPECFPDLRYRYSVNGNSYEGSRLSFGPGLNWRVSEKDAGKRMVQVAYNPSSPEDAVLVRGAKYSTTLVLAIIGLLIGLLTYLIEGLIFALPGGMVQRIKRFNHEPVSRKLIIALSLISLLWFSIM